MSYLLFKYLHIFAVAISFALFFIRGMWVMRAYPTVHEFWARNFPALIDAVLVGSALMMLSTSKQSLSDGWMISKLSLLAVYVLLALAALRWAKRFVVRLVVWAAALLVFLFMTTVAVLHHPLGILSLL